jgi:hypothetical protein
MRNSVSYWFYQSVFAGAIFIAAAGCTKESSDSSSSPAITTAEVTGITQTNATCGGTVTSDGGAAVTARGVCWNTSPLPTLAGNHTADGSGTGTFVSTLTGLTNDKVYYVRAYATNSKGTSYGNQVSFSNSPNPTFWLGQSYGGGKVFYLDGSRGLIVAPAVYSAKWSNYPFDIITATALFTGKTNTNLIANSDTNYTARNAASICRDYDNGSGWFLPSRDELAEMVKNKDYLDLNDNSNYYWSSSHVNTGQAWCVNFYGNYIPKDKTLELSLRPVRRFDY